MKEGLSNTFKMKDMGQLRYCLGNNCELTKQGISLCQKQYVTGPAKINHVSTKKLPIFSVFALS